MTPPQTPKLVRWGRAAVVVAVGLAAVGAFALITPSYELDSEAFLRLVFAQQAEVRSVHVTSIGMVTMSNGDVHRTRGEHRFPPYGGDSQGYIEYEGCPVSIGRMSEDIRLCKTEWVELGGIRYERQTTFGGHGRVGDTGLSRRSSPTRLTRHATVRRSPTIGAGATAAWS